MQPKSNVIPLFKQDVKQDNELRASEWEVSHLRGIRKGLMHGFKRYRAIVTNYDRGLTDKEAWQVFINSLDIADPFKPEFHQCVCTVLNPWPYPNTKNEKHHA